MATFFLTLVLLELLARAIKRLTPERTKVHNALSAPPEAQYYPLFPSRFYKIAIFGESVAAGYGAEVNFGSVLASCESPRNMKTYVHNFSGGNFSGLQSAIWKNCIEHFDCFIFLGGSNENSTCPSFLEYIEKTQGSAPTSEEINHSIQEQSNKKCQFLFLKNRINRLVKNCTIQKLVIGALAYNVSFKIIRKINAHSGKINNHRAANLSPSSKNKNPFNILNWDYIVNSPTITKSDTRAFQTTFMETMDSVLSLTEQHGKKAVVIKPPMNVFYPPQESIVEGQDADQLKALNRETTEIIDCLYENGLPDLSALLKVRDADSIDTLVTEHPNCAIFNFFSGLKHLANENYDAGEGFLRKSTELDYPILGKFSDTFRLDGKTLNAICSQYKNCLYIDAEKLFFRFLDQPRYFQSLFVDYAHLSALGHVLVGFSILGALKDLKLRTTADFNLDQLSFGALEQELLSQREWHDIGNLETINTLRLHFRWQLSLSCNISFKKILLNSVESSVRSWRDLSLQSGLNENLVSSEFHFWNSVYLLLIGEIDQSAKESEKSKAASLTVYKRLMRSTTANGIQWKHIIDRYANRSA